MWDGVLEVVKQAWRARVDDRYRRSELENGKKKHRECRVDSLKIDCLSWWW